MNIVLWIIQSLIAIIFLGIGAFKTFGPKQKLQKISATSITTTRLLGFLELPGAVGIILPFLLNIYPSLTAIAGVCLGIVMGGAIILHLQKKEYKALPLVIRLLILCITISINRY